MIIAGHQLNYLPWLGFFDKMIQSDVFIIEDCVQFERQGFTNRNRIKTFQGVKWVTVPVDHSSLPSPISDVMIANRDKPDWRKQHWSLLKHNYSRAPYWRKFSAFFEKAYSQEWTRLIDLNMHLMRGLMHFLKVHKPLTLASSLGASGHKSNLILSQCKKLGATKLLLGTGARSYINCQPFERENIEVIFQDFKYPIYPQLFGKFVPNLSAVDYLFWTGGKKWRLADKTLLENV